MKRNRGFTLVELLVVMAIIAILASIVVPNVQRYISRARVARAVAEVSGMDLSLTAIMTDAGRANFSQLFNPNAVRARLEWPDSIDDNRFSDPMATADLFTSASNLYSQVTYDLLRLGRDCLRAGSGSIAPDFIDRDILSRLGTNYMDIGLDPWQEVYRVWPGPWRFSREPHGAGEIPGGRWPIPFRVFSVEGGGANTSYAVQRDGFVLGVEGTDLAEIYTIMDPETWPSRVNYPAQANKSVFIWSYGQNNRSSQMLYQAVYDPTDPNSWFYQEEEEDIAGGDDINNWDNGNSWERFYR